MGRLLLRGQVEVAWLSNGLIIGAEVTRLAEQFVTGGGVENVRLVIAAAP